MDILEARLRVVENRAGEVDMLETSLRMLENNTDPGGGGDYRRETRDSETKGYLPFKSTIPESLGNDPRNGELGKRTPLVYFDSTTLGRKAYLLDREEPGGYQRRAGSRGGLEQVIVGERGQRTLVECFERNDN